MSDRSVSSLHKQKHEAWEVFAPRLKVGDIIAIVPQDLATPTQYGRVRDIGAHRAGSDDPYRLAAVTQRGVTLLVEIQKDGNHSLKLQAQGIWVSAPVGDVRTAREEEGSRHQWENDHCRLPPIPVGALHGGSLAISAGPQSLVEAGLWTETSGRVIEEALTHRRRRRLLDTCASALANLFPDHQISTTGFVSEALSLIRQNGSLNQYRDALRDARARNDVSLKKELDIILQAGGKGPSGEDLVQVFEDLSIENSELLLEYAKERKIPIGNLAVARNNLSVVSHPKEEYEFLFPQETRIMQAVRFNSAELLPAGKALSSAEQRKILQWLGKRCPLAFGPDVKIEGEQVLIKRPATMKSGEDRYLWVRATWNSPDGIFYYGIEYHTNHSTSSGMSPTSKVFRISSLGGSDGTNPKEFRVNELYAEEYLKALAGKDSPFTKDLCGNNWVSEDLIAKVMAKHVQLRSREELLLLQAVHYYSW